MMRRFPHLAALLFLVVGLACGSDATSPRANIAGTWNLQTANGSALPYTFNEGSFYKQELMSLVYTLTAASPSGGSYVAVETQRITVSGNVSVLPESLSGSYSVTDTSVLFQSPGNIQTWSGSWTGNTMTLKASIGTWNFIFVR